MQIPPGFCLVRDRDSSILQDLRYASTENFAGAVVDGYAEMPSAVLTTAACDKLCLAQQKLLEQGYCLVIYDGYRPQRAVDCFVRWSSAEAISSEAASKKAAYYPLLERERLFDLGYIAAKSGHSRGSTVDVTIISAGASLRSPTLTHRQLASSSSASYPFLDDGTVDMGTSFDLFDPISHHDCDASLLPPEFTLRRNILRTAMESVGFRAYNQEWWHYTLVDEPFPDTYFNF